MWISYNFDIDYKLLNRPRKVIVSFTIEGMENVSGEFTFIKVKEIIKYQERKKCLLVIEINKKVSLEIWQIYENN